MRSPEPALDERKARRKAEVRQAFLDRLRENRAPAIEPEPRKDADPVKGDEAAGPLSLRREAHGKQPEEGSSIKTSHHQTRLEESRAAALQAEQHREQDLAALRQRRAEEVQVRAARLADHERLARQADAERAQRQQEIEAAARRKQEEAAQAEALVASRRETERLAEEREAALSHRREEQQAAARQKEEEKKQAEARAIQLREEQRLAQQNEAEPAQSPDESRAVTKQIEERRAEAAAAKHREQQRLAQQAQLARQQREAELREARLQQQRETQEQAVERQRLAATAELEEKQRRQLHEQELLREEAARRDRQDAIEQKRQLESTVSPPPRPVRPQPASGQPFVAAKNQESKRIAASIASTQAPSAPPPPSDEIFTLNVSGNFLIDENGNALNLRGVTVRGLDTVAPSAQTFPAALTLDDNSLSNMADVWHANLVRLPFQAQTILSGNGTLTSAQILTGLDLAVSAIVGAGLFVLLSLEAPPGSTVAAPDANALKAWQALAPRYAAEPRVLYEVFCSPSALAADWPQSATNLINAIRQQNPAAIVFVGSGKGGASVAGLPLLLSTGTPVPNVVYTIAVSAQMSPNSDDGTLRALAASFPVFASLWSDDGSDFDRSSPRVADLFTRYGIGWAASSWNADPRLVADAANQDFTPTSWGTIAQHALAMPPVVLLKDSNIPPNTPPQNTSAMHPLTTSGNYIVDQNGHPVTLRGVSVRGLDTITLSPNQTCPAALSLDANNLAVITGVWHANLIRLPFQAATMLTGNGSLSSADMLAGLDLTVAAITGVGAYVLLSLEPLPASGTAPVDNITTLQLWQMLAEHYKQNPGVLFEIFSSMSPLVPTWLQFAATLIASIRQRNPGALIFIGNGNGGGNVTGLPLQLSAGNSFFNVVYTIGVSPQSIPSPDDGNLRALVESYPVFASLWSDDGSDLGRSAARVADLFDRYGIGWTACNWNAEPRLINDAAGHDFSPTGWGLVVGRALGQPARPLLVAFSGVQ